MPEEQFNLEVVCPKCGLGQQLGIAAFRGATPDMVETIKHIMEVERAQAVEQAKTARLLQAVRFLWYICGGMMVIAAMFYASGPELVSRWTAVVANLTGAVSTLVCAAWLVDLKIWTVRP